jgi:hypothetical protein
MKEEISTITIYDGSVMCRKCGKIMTPVEVFYMDGDVCSDCRNTSFGKHIKGGMIG